jgi:hypothetical protein
MGFYHTATESQFILPVRLFLGLLLPSSGQFLREIKIADYVFVIFLV